MPSQGGTAIRTAETFHNAEGQWQKFERSQAAYNSATTCGINVAKLRSLLESKPCLQAAILDGMVFRGSRLYAKNCVARDELLSKSGNSVSDRTLKEIQQPNGLLDPKVMQNYERLIGELKVKQNAAASDLSENRLLDHSDEDSGISSDNDSDDSSLSCNATAARNEGTVANVQLDDKCFYMKLLDGEEFRTNLEDIINSYHEQVIHDDEPRPFEPSSKKPKINELQLETLSPDVWAAHRPDSKPPVKTLSFNQTKKSRIRSFFDAIIDQLVRLWIRMRYNLPQREDRLKTLIRRRLEAKEEVERTSKEWESYYTMVNHMAQNILPRNKAVWPEYNYWKDQLAQASGSKRSLERKIAKLDRQILMFRLESTFLPN